MSNPAASCARGSASLSRLVLERVGSSRPGSCSGGRGEIRAQAPRRKWSISLANASGESCWSQCEEFSILFRRALGISRASRSPSVMVCMGSQVSGVASPLGRGAHLRVAGPVAAVQQKLREAARDCGSDDLRRDEPARAEEVGASSMKRYRLGFAFAKPPLCARGAWRTCDYDKSNAATARRPPP